MKTLDELKHFYRHDLQRELRQVENSRRNAIVGILIVFGLCVTAVAAVFWAYPSSRLGQGGWGVIVAFLAVPLFIVIAVILVTRYKRLFKRQIMTRLVGYMSEGLRYDPKGSVPRQDFDASRLFAATSYNRYQGEDLIAGEIDGFSLTFSELIVSRQGSGKNNNNTTVFHGLFLVAEAAEPFRGVTVVLPSMNVQLDKFGTGMLGSLARSLIERFLPKPSGERLELGDAAFEAHFDVYADDREEGERLLDAPMRQRLVALREHLGKPLRVSFCRDRIYVALEERRDLFEPKLTRTVRNYDLVRHFFEAFSMACNVVVAVSRR